MCRLGRLAALAVMVALLRRGLGASPLARAAVDRNRRLELTLLFALGLLLLVLVQLRTNLAVELLASIVEGEFVHAHAEREREGELADGGAVFVIAGGLDAHGGGDELRLRDERPGRRSLELMSQVAEVVDQGVRHHDHHGSALQGLLDDVLGAVGDAVDGASVLARTAREALGLGQGVRPSNVGV